MNSITATPQTAPKRPQRTIALMLGAAALVGMGALAACGAKEKPADTAPPASSPAGSAQVSATEKSIKPGTNGTAPSNSFSPTVKARPAPTALPGNVITGG